ELVLSRGGRPQPPNKSPLKFTGTLVSWLVQTTSASQSMFIPEKITSNKLEEIRRGGRVGYGAGSREHAEKKPGYNAKTQKHGEETKQMTHAETRRTRRKSRGP